VTTTLRGQRLEAPEMPSGELRLQAPPELDRSEGASGVMMNAIPMLGSLGSIVLVASMGAGGGGGRSYIAAGMFLFATLGFIVVQIDRQRKQRAQSVTGSRTEYLRYLSSVRTVAREAAAQQRRALTWQHPEPGSLPALAEERSRVWERGAGDPTFLHVRYGVCSQELALRLVPPESAPIDQVDPAAASALHRLLVVHRNQPDLPASLDLRAFDRIEVCGSETSARGLARALVCSATAFHSPDQLVVAVLAGERQLAHWDWVKWLPHAHSARVTDAVGPRRMVATSLDELAVLLLLDGADLPPGNHVVPPDGLHGVTVVDLPSRWDELEDATRLRLAILDDPAAVASAPTPVATGDARASGTVALEAVRVREQPVRARGDQCDLATAEAFARRLTALHTVTAGSGVPDEAAPLELSGSTDFMDLLGLGDVHAFDADAAWRPRPARDRLRASARAACRPTWTSRSPPSRAWARTAS
jgi:S-DNA-T family DNA segregation ATPase FtsK/SpoIIIE